MNLCPNNYLFTLRNTGFFDQLIGFHTLFIISYMWLGDVTKVAKLCEVDIILILLTIIN